MMTPVNSNQSRRKNGLVLSGGGARAAYQIGVLKALSEIYPRSEKLPFHIISGTSAGAINAAALAANANNFRLAVLKAEKMWSQIRVDDVYKTGPWSIIASVSRLFYSLLHHGYGRQAVAMLDSGPLWRYVSKNIPLADIQKRIDSGCLDAIGVTASSYASGGSITFYSGNNDIHDWAKGKRFGMRTKLGVEHLLASSAIPAILPAVKIDNHYYGDGALRQVSPLSPALHLGAQRLMVIGVSNNSMAKPAPIPRDTNAHTPSFAGILGHVFNSAFIDAFDSDIENLSRINQLIGMVHNSDPYTATTPFYQVDLLSINPSQPIDAIAEKHQHNMPHSVRLLLNILGATSKGGGSSIASYLMFDGNFCRELITLGYEDGMANKDLMTQFYMHANELPQL